MTPPLGKKPWKPTECVCQLISYSFYLVSFLSHYLSFSFSIFLFTSVFLSLFISLYYTLSLSISPCPPIFKTCAPFIFQIRLDGEPNFVGQTTFKGQDLVPAFNHVCPNCYMPPMVAVKWPLVAVVLENRGPRAVVVLDASKDFEIVLSIPNDKVRLGFCWWLG